MIHTIPIFHFGPSHLKTDLPHLQASTFITAASTSRNHAALPNPTFHTCGLALASVGRPNNNWWKLRSNNPTAVASSAVELESASNVVRKFYDGINRRDLASVEDLVSLNCIYEDLVFPRPFIGRKAIFEFFKQFMDSISTDLQFAIDDISRRMPVLWGKGCSFYRLDVVNGQRQIVYGRDCVEPAIKPGETALVIIRGVTWVLQKFPFLADRSAGLFGLTSSINHRLLKYNIRRPFGEALIIGLSQVALSHSRGRSMCPSIRMTMVDERLADTSFVKPADILAYDLVQGADVRWSYILDKTAPQPPTAVLLHGILGSRKNWGTFARRLAKEFPKWQFLLVDLRCHGDSASLKKRGPHTVASAALDVLKLLGQLKLTPRVVVGHSFGGKVALSMVDQVAKPLARPVRVWVLDSTPGKVRAGADGDDHPAELISFLSTLPKERSCNEVLEFTTVFLYILFYCGLFQTGCDGCSCSGWLLKRCGTVVVTNLRESGVNGASSSNFSWVFDLKGIADMYQSYEETNLWKLVEDVPRGVHINFLKAERSLHRWALEDLRRIHVAEEQAAEEGGGVEMHVLEDAGHWTFHCHFKALSSNFLALPIQFLFQVHADNPDGLFRILSFSFQGF
ncbi:UNVERIFIED_CONTAM: protein ABHD11 [Sesamum angustifolium]|uniref:Protein ABHD11 n=1 Tax=Sesamum angustifolium TaxID=2727405 RepID=A0AAW2L8J7_9LAMI